MMPLDAPNYFIDDLAAVTAIINTSNAEVNADPEATSDVEEPTDAKELSEWTI